jgi:hypothetical protein
MRQADGTQRNEVIPWLPKNQYRQHHGLFSRLSPEWIQAVLATGFSASVHTPWDQIISIFNRFSNYFQGF